MRWLNLLCAVPGLYHLAIVSSDFNYLRVKLCLVGSVVIVTQNPLGAFTRTPILMYAYTRIQLYIYYLIPKQYRSPRFLLSLIPVAPGWASWATLEKLVQMEPEVACT